VQGELEIGDVVFDGKKVSRCLMYTGTELDADGYPTCVLFSGSLAFTLHSAHTAAAVTRANGLHSEERHSCKQGHTARRSLWHNGVLDATAPIGDKGGVGWHAGGRHPASRF
jgi:hypothetical protein